MPLSWHSVYCLSCVYALWVWRCAGERQLPRRRRLRSPRRSGEESSGATGPSGNLQKNSSRPLIIIIICIINLYDWRSSLQVGCWPLMCQRRGSTRHVTFVASSSEWNSYEWHYTKWLENSLFIWGCNVCTETCFNNYAEIYSIRNTFIWITFIYLKRRRQCFKLSTNPEKCFIHLLLYNGKANYSIYQCSPMM